MNSSTKQILIAFLSLWINCCFAQSELHLVNIGDLKQLKGKLSKIAKSVIEQ